MHYLLHPFIYRLFYYFKFENLTIKILFYYFKFENLTIKIRPFKCTHFYFIV